MESEEIQELLEGGSTEAIVLIAYLRLKGIEVQRDVDSAIRLLRDVATNNLSPFAEFLLGEVYIEEMNEPDFDEAFHWYERSSEHDFVLAHLRLATCYEHGYGVTQDESKALELVLRAAESNSVLGQEYAGLMYAEGIGTPIDADKSYSWYLRAAQNGSPGAAFNAAYFYEEGIGVLKDLGTALHWYKNAAELGSWSAHDRLASIYEYGLLEQEQNQILAAEHRRKSELLRPGPREE